MEEKFNIVKKSLLFLQSYSKTRFGSAVIGFLLCLLIVYYGVIKNQIDVIESYKSENKDLKNALKESNERLITIREETRKEAQLEAKQYINYTYSLIQNMRNELSDKKAEKVQKLRQLESELEKKM